MLGRFAFPLIATVAQPVRGISAIRLLACDAHCVITRPHIRCERERAEMLHELMDGRVFTTGDDFQVAQSVVRAVAIDVMHVFPALELSPNGLLDNPSVFPHATTTTKVESDVTVWGQRSGDNGIVTGYRSLQSTDVRPGLRHERSPAFRCLQANSTRLAGI